MKTGSTRNISDAERWGSMIGGAALTLYGLSRFSRGGWILSAFGVLLFRRGATAHCHTYDLFGVSTAEGSDMLPPHGDPLSHQLRGIREG
ncbi:MAG TPA: DUF2892 domain-containing protein [Vicinamibacterales bacterium]|jgi:uncharacterized membrane protein